MPVGLENDASGLNRPVLRPRGLTSDLNQCFVDLRWLTGDWYLLLGYFLLNKE